jgi:hypothetical protein
MFLLAARNDEIVAPAQTFATEQLTRSPARELRKAMASTTHLGLFFGRRILADEWMRIARWLRRRERAVKSPA